mmetsp:Transcript_12756/g.36420  ORF Transcript_12756/g.36420 Transcript_12756/m.36420 type:complete len:303 (+) Transcript_12756:1544-2452(+)
MQQNDRTALVDIVRLARQDFRVHNGQHVRVDLHPLLLPGADLGRQPVVHGLSQPRLELLDASLQEQLHNVRQRILHDVVLPTLEGELRIELPQLPHGDGKLRLGRQGVVHRRRAVHPRILRRFPRLLRVLADVFELLLGLGRAGLFVHDLGLAEDVLNDGSIAQPPLHPLPRPQMFLLVNDHDGRRSLVLVGGGIVVFGNLAVGQISDGIVNALVDALRLAGVEEVRPRFGDDAEEGGGGIAGLVEEFVGLVVVPEGGGVFGDLLAVLGLGAVDGVTEGVSASLLLLLRRRRLRLILCCAVV